MDATQVMKDSLLESDEEENEDHQTSRGRPVAKLLILKNEHMSETGEWMNVRVIVPELYICVIRCIMCFFFPLTQNCRSFWEKMFWAGMAALARHPSHHPQFQSGTQPSQSPCTDLEVM